MYKFAIYRGAREVGGNQIFLSSGDTNISLDFGVPMGSEYFQYGRGPKTWGHRMYIGELPKIDGLYRNGLVESEGLRRTEEPFLKYVWLSHAHPDHKDGIPFLHKKTTLVTSPRTHLDLQNTEKTNRTKVFMAYPLSLMPLFRPENQSYYGYAYVLDKIPTFSKRTGKKKRKGRFDFSKPIIGHVVTKKKDQEPIPPRPLIKSDRLEFGKSVLEAFPVDHNIDAQGAVIRTPDMTIVYTGDFREGPNSERFFSERVPKRPDLLIMEATTAGRLEKGQEKSLEINQVSEELVKRIKDYEFGGPLFIRMTEADKTTLMQIERAAGRLGKMPLVSPELAYSLKQTDSMYPGISEGIGVWQRESGITLDEEFAEGFKKQVYKKFKDKVFSDQDIAKKEGEYIRIITKRQKDIEKFFDWRPTRGLFVDTTTEAWNEETGIQFEKTENFIRSFHLNFTRVHSSGHADQSYSLQKIEQIDPKMVMLIHVSEDEIPYNGRMVPICEYHGDRVKDLMGDRTIVVVPVRGATYDLVPGGRPMVGMPISSEHLPDKIPEVPPTLPPPLPIAQVVESIIEEKKVAQPKFAVKKLDKWQDSSEQTEPEKV